MNDAALLHATLWHFASHRIRLLPQPEQKDKLDLLTHQFKAIQLVNERLGDEENRLTDSTVASVACIAAVEVGNVPSYLYSY